MKLKRLPTRSLYCAKEKSLSLIHIFGQTLECKFLSVDERKRRVVLSARAVLEEQLDSVWEKIVVGETFKGKVVRMTDFGAFVDLGGVDGLIHVSDISWQRIEKPADVLEIGQEVEPVV